MLLRAIAILLVVGTHANLFTVYGGAHILLAVAGYNFARFQLGDVPRATRLRSGLRCAGPGRDPEAVWIGMVGLRASARTSPQPRCSSTVSLGSDAWTTQWQFWFLEAGVWTLAAALGVIAVPAMDRAERRSPFVFALVVLVVGSPALRAGGRRGRSHRALHARIVFWCFALGWAAAPRRRCARTPAGLGSGDRDGPRVLR